MGDADAEEAGALHPRDVDTAIARTRKENAQLRRLVTQFSA